QHGILFPECRHHFWLPQARDETFKPLLRSFACNLLLNSRDVQLQYQGTIQQRHDSHQSILKKNGLNALSIEGQFVCCGEESRQTRAKLLQRLSKKSRGSPQEARGFSEIR